LRGFAKIAVAAALVAAGIYAQSRTQGKAPKGPIRPLTASRADEPKYQQLDSSEALFAVMAAINAAGFDNEADSPTNHPLRKAIRDHFAQQNLPVMPALKRYVRDHKPRNPALELSQYISFALLVKGPPNFAWREPNLPPPPDVMPIDDFGPMVTQFYAEGNVGELWKQVQPTIDQAIRQYTEPVSRAVLLSNSYVREPVNTDTGKRFQIFIDLLGSPNQVQTRHYLFDDYIVITPHAELPIEEIRHAYLRHMVDPLSFKYDKELKKKGALIDYALGSPILDEAYRNDFPLLATECLIRAIESRIDRKPAMVEQALREGFVVTPAFAELLAKYETQEQSLRLYFPDLINGIDLRKEEKRLEHIDFVSTKPVRTNRVTKVEDATPVLTGLAKTLDEGEQAFTKRDAAGAKKIFLGVLQEAAEKPVHARAYYGLARVALLERDPETADRLFRKAIETEPDVPTRAWCLLYLAKLADSQGEKDEAQDFYKQTLAVPGLPDQVRQDAEKGLKGAYARSQQ
jgi:hypothetical protein